MSTNEFDELDDMIEQNDLPYDEVEFDPDLVPEDGYFEKTAGKGSSKKSSRANKQPVLSEEDEKIESVDEVYWYVVHCYSGYENKVCHNLEQRIETMGMKDMIIITDIAIMAMTTTMMRMKYLPAGEEKLPKSSVRML